MTIYSELQVAATELLTEFGSKVTITRDDTTIAQPLCVFSLRQKDNQPGSMSTTEDVRVAIITGNFKGVPAVGDHLITEHEDLTIMNVKQIRPQPSGIILCYKLELN